MYSRHIETENDTLFPKAEEVILDKSKWEKMKVECDKIGYTSFYNPNKDKWYCQYLILLNLYEFFVCYTEFKKY